MMDAERFEQLAAAYGGAPERWPEAERDAALAFMAADRTAAERILFEARLIDAALDASPQPQVSQALRDRILADAPRPRTERKLGFEWFGLRGWAAGAAMAAACAVGVVTGAFTVQQMAAHDADSLIAQAAEAPLEAEEYLG